MYKCNNERRNMKVMQYPTENILQVFGDTTVNSALWDLTPLFQLYGGPKTNFLIWTVPLEIISVPPCIWLVRTASSLRLAETNSEDPFFFSEVLAQI